MNSKRSIKLQYAAFIFVYFFSIVVKFNIKCKYNIRDRMRVVLYICIIIQLYT